VTAPIILDLGLVLLAAAGGGWLARRIGLPAVIGYLVVGLLVSPFTPGYVADRNQIQLLADVGVALLLFEVGIEIDIHKLRIDHRSLLVLAPLQMLITTVASAAVLTAVGLDLNPALLIGLAIAPSSAVVVVNITRSRRRTTDVETEREMLGWSVLQDVTLVAAAAVVLGLVGVSDRDPVIAVALFAVFAVFAAGAAWVLPRILVRLRSEPDLFLIVSVAAGLAIAAVGDFFFHVPLALAAFIAGLAIADSPASAEARQRLLPFRDLFAVLFFVAVGSLIDPVAIGEALPQVVLVIGLVFLAKFVVSYVLARAGGLARPGQLAIGLGQVGEFSFVLVSAGAVAGVVPREWFAATLAAVVVTIAVSAVAARLVHRDTPAVPRPAAPPVAS
jgi:CPA2 family monovalent cation:H+ antiporter-2